MTKWYNNFSERQLHQFRLFVQARAQGNRFIRIFGEPNPQALPPPTCRATRAPSSQASTCDSDNAVRTVLQFPGDWPRSGPGACGGWAPPAPSIPQQHGIPAAPVPGAKHFPPYQGPPVQRHGFAPPIQPGQPVYGAAPFLRGPAQGAVPLARGPMMGAAPFVSGHHSRTMMPASQPADQPASLPAGQPASRPTGLPPVRTDAPMMHRCEGGSFASDGK